jgi:hypothetical protein
VSKREGEREESGTNGERLGALEGKTKGAVPVGKGKIGVSLLLFCVT